MSNTNRLLMLVIIVALLAGCSAPPAGQPPAPATIVAETPATATPGSEAIATPESATPDAATADPNTLCPQETADAALYVSIENGYCFLYPSSLALQPDMLRPDDAVQLIGPLADPGAMETVALNLTVANNGPADGLDSAQYAAMWIQRNVPGQELAQMPATIGGQPAAVVDYLPGMFSQRSGFVVAGDVKYQVTMQPLPQDSPQLTDAATQAWDTLTGSIVFFPPQNDRTYVRSADVCPTAPADTKLLIDEAGGYCLLYPADFEVDPNAPSTIVGGPELGPYADFPSVRASLAIGTYPLTFETAEQALQPPIENSDPNSATPTTIAGYPAVTYDFIAGPWLQRNAAVVVGDRAYTFVAQPWDSDLFPLALPDVERLWNTASSTIVFFDPWR
jgi:hypothetical protein